MVEYGSKFIMTTACRCRLKKGIATAKTISEAEREVKVIRETDVIWSAGAGRHCSRSVGSKKRSRYDSH